MALFRVNCMVNVMLSFYSDNSIMQDNLIVKQYFTYDEFKCPCCGACEMDNEFMRMLYTARLMTYMMPFHINSGYRCEEYDKKIGSNSGNHRGYAADIGLWEGQAGSKRIYIVPALLKAGFKRIGIHETYIHVDNCPGKPWSIWL